jgi:hypothetical protein
LTITAKINQAIFEESGMAKEIDEKLGYLSTTIHRLKIIDNIVADVNEAHLDKSEWAALNLAASILEYLIVVLEHFNKPPTSKILSLASVGRPEVVVAIVGDDRRIVHSSRDFDKAIDGINNAIDAYMDGIKARNPVITRLLWLPRRFRYLWRRF